MDNLSPTAEGQPSMVPKMLEELQIVDNDDEQNKCLDRILNYLTSADNGKNCFVHIESFYWLFKKKTIQQFFYMPYIRYFFMSCRVSIRMRKFFDVFC
jgi:hypothetical protein